MKQIATYKEENDIKNEEYLNRVLHGSCFEWLPYLEDKSVDMILCDLPYQVTGQSWDVIIPFDLLWKEYERIIKDNGAIVLTACQPFTSALGMSNPKLLKYEWIWEKDQGRNFQLAKKQPLKITENILVFYKKQPTYNPQGLIKLDKPIVKSNKGKGGSLGHIASEGKRETYLQEYTNYPKNLLKFNSERGLHPTQKPVALFEYLIKTYTNEGETVLDNCLGSGTTAIACINTNRSFIGIEQDWDYCNIANERIKKALELKV